MISESRGADLSLTLKPEKQARVWKELKGASYSANK